MNLLRKRKFDVQHPINVILAVCNYNLIVMHIYWNRRNGSEVEVYKFYF